MIAIITDCYTEALEDEERLTMTEKQLGLLDSTCNFGTPNIQQLGRFEQTTKLKENQEEVSQWKEEDEGQKDNEEEEEEGAESVEDSNLFNHTET